MKRSAAVTGPTPSFLRWAIERKCILRDGVVEDSADGKLPVSTFRQLRNIRSLAEGIARDSVVDGFCLHPSASKADHDSARGFFVDEVFDVCGSNESLDAACSNCHANANDGSETAWAGCHGWLPVDPSWDLDETSRAAPTETLIDCAEFAVQRLPDGLSVRTLTSPAWYGMWIDGPISGQRLNGIEFVLARLVENEACASSRFLPHLLDAVRRCANDGMTLHVDLVPPGHSDGNVWKIDACCANCCGPVESLSGGAERVCSICNQVAGITTSRRAKVLGMRPYLLLSKILGIDRTKEVVSKLGARKKRL